MRLDQLDLLLQKECQLVRNRPILVGVSGGPDSLCLADALNRLGYPLVVAHFHHQLRPESMAEAEHVRAFARERSLPFELDGQDVAAIARREGLSIEEAARNTRYPFLFAIARKIDAQAVAVGHTADDQVETVLMHLLRGAGLAGLKGMRFSALVPEWDETIPLVRPLLATWREETLQYCQGNSLQPVFDASNQDPAYFRNRLRLELIPYLERFNPGIRPILLRTSRSLAGDYDLIQDTVSQAWNDCVIQRESSYVRFDLRKVQSYPVGLLRAILRQAVGQLRPAMRDFDFGAIDRGVDYIQAQSPHGQCDLAGGLFLEAEGDSLYLAQWSAGLPTTRWPQLKTHTSIQLKLGDQLDLEHDWVLCSQVVEGGVDWQNLPDNPFEAWLDADTLAFPLVVRRRRAGDSFQPLGMDGRSVKLSDFFVNVKLAQRARDAWPLVFSGDTIAWVAGYRPSHLYRIHPETRRVIRLQLVHEPASDEAGGD